MSLLHMQGMKLLKKYGSVDLAISELRCCGNLDSGSMMNTQDNPERISSLTISQNHLLRPYNYMIVGYADILHELKI